MGAVAGDPGILRPAFRVCGVYQISRFADGEMRRFGIDSLSDEGYQVRNWFGAGGARGKGDVEVRLVWD